MPATTEAIRSLSPEVQTFDGTRQAPQLVERAATPQRNAQDSNHKAAAEESPLSSVASFDLDKALQQLQLDQGGEGSPWVDPRTASTVYYTASPGEGCPPAGGYLPPDSAEGTASEASSAELRFARSAMATVRRTLHVLSGV